MEDDLKKVCPGDKILKHEFYGGYGFCENDDKEYLNCYISGKVSQLSNMLSVQHNRHWNPFVGDILVGRVSRIESKRWSIDIKQNLWRVFLKLGAIEMPDDEVRVRSVEDSQKMMGLFMEGDCIVSEITDTNRDINMLQVRIPRAKKYCGSKGYGFIGKYRDSKINFKNRFHECDKIEVVFGTNYLYFAGLKKKFDHSKLDEKEKIKLLQKIENIRKYIEEFDGNFDVSRAINWNY